ncbi:hypothetical protein GCM10009801_64960 [Streptomyces albiaxialis]|uniref:Uncharacterized protein n=1 Tax=Streptomyces albiaxialis TaxID=329523 RepID=A0ABN2WNU9_9ACTN
MVPDRAAAVEGAAAGGTSAAAATVVTAAAAASAELLRMRMGPPGSGTCRVPSGAGEGEGTNAGRDLDVSRPATAAPDRSRSLQVPDTLR